MILAIEGIALATGIVDALQERGGHERPFEDTASYITGGCAGSNGRIRPQALDGCGAAT
jgi:hypothetical protein